MIPNWQRKTAYVLLILHLTPLHSFWHTLCTDLEVPLADGYVNTVLWALFYLPLIIKVQ